MQGKSIVPILKNQKPKDWRKSLYYHYYEYPGAHSVRRHEGVTTQDYKLIRFYGKDVLNGEEWELYNLKKDPSEMKNEYLNSKYKKKITELKEQLVKLKKEYKVLEK